MSAILAVFGNLNNIVSFVTLIILGPLKHLLCFSDKVIIHAVHDEGIIHSIGDITGASDILYEPDSTEAFEAIVPEYLGGIVYGALCESRAAEQAARRTAMDAATSNAEDMIADLSLKFNQARQAAITQEITEIVAGS